MLRDFRVVASLGKGSFGTVQRVVRRKDGKEYALKRMQLPPGDPRTARDALTEVRFLASLQHPHIVRFHEAFPHGARELCLVLEYAGGGDLAKVIKRHQRTRKPLGERRLWRYAQEVCSGLHFLHGHGILHRDIKPANCFLDAQGSVKIGDFNISKLTGRGCLTRTHIGTPYYMSPEIWRHQAYGAKTDMWSFGCLLYELSALRVPFQAHSVQALAQAVRRGWTPALSTRYTRKWRAIVASLLRALPVQRPTTGELLAGPLGYGELPRLVPRKPLLRTIRMTPYARQLGARMPKPQYSAVRESPPRARPPRRLALPPI